MGHAFPASAVAVMLRNVLCCVCAVQDVGPLNVPPAEDVDDLLNMIGYGQDQQGMFVGGTSGPRKHIPWSVSTWLLIHTGKILPKR